MEGKKKVNIYTDWNETISELTDSEAGKLFKHLMSYVNDEKPKELTGKLKLVWIPIKQTLKRDLEKWLKTCEKNRDNANKRWRTDATASDGMRSDTKNADKDKDKDKDIDKDSIIREVLADNSQRFLLAVKYIGVTPVIGKYLLKDLFLSRAKEYTTAEDFWRHFESWGKKFEVSDAHRSEAKRLYQPKGRYKTYEELEG